MIWVYMVPRRRAMASMSGFALPMPLVEEMEEGNAITAPENNTLEGAGSSASGRTHLVLV